MNPHRLLNPDRAASAAGSADTDRAPDVVVSCRGAAVTLGNRVLWRDVDLDVGPGSFAAVLGPNGVGKSTFVRAILGLQRMSAGTVTVLGQPAGAANSRIGYLPQRRSFDAGVRVRGRDLVRLGLDGHRYGLPVSLPGSRARRAANERVDEVIAAVGATELANRPIGRLSGGEQQRLLIAQALASSPRLLLLDEPLDSLDLPNQAAVAALIQRISRAHDVSVVMVAHDVNPIQPYLDQVIYLAAGGAVSGPPEQVITSEVLTALYSTPIEVLRTSDGRLVVVGHPEAPALHTDRHTGLAAP